MTLYILGYIYILISLFCRKRYNVYLGLFLVLIVMGFQSGVPGDYDGYKAIFAYMSSVNANTSLLQVEKGWSLLNQFFSHIGTFHLFVFCVSLIQYLILARFIDIYADTRFKFLSGLIFYFSINMMLFQMKGLRQGLAIDLCVFSLMCLEKRKTILSFILVYLAYNFHTSTLLFAPFLFLYILIKDSRFLKNSYKNKELIIPIFTTSTYLAIYLLKENVLDYIRPILLSQNLMGYEGYFGQIKFVSYHPLITFYGCVATFSTSWYLLQSKNLMRFFSFLTLLSLFVEMLFFGLGDLYRFSLFYGIFSIVIYPNISSQLYQHNHRVLSWLFAILTIAYALRTFITQTIRNSPDGFDNYGFLFLAYL